MRTADTTFPPLESRHHHSSPSFDNAYVRATRAGDGGRGASGSWGEVRPSVTTPHTIAIRIVAARDARRLTAASRIARAPRVATRRRAGRSRRRRGRRGVVRGLLILRRLRLRLRLLHRLRGLLLHLLHRLPGLLRLLLLLLPRRLRTVRRIRPLLLLLLLRPPPLRRLLRLTRSSRVRLLLPARRIRRRTAQLVQSAIRELHPLRRLRLRVALHVLIPALRAVLVRRGFVAIGALAALEHRVAVVGRSIIRSTRSCRDPEHCSYDPCARAAE